MKLLAGAGLLLVLLAGCGGTAAAPTNTASSTTPASSAAPANLKTIKLAFAGIGPETGPPYVADKQGYFAQEGLKMELVSVSGGPEALAALTGGSIDFMQMGSSTLFNAVQKQVPVKALLADEQGMWLYTVFGPKAAKDSGIQADSPADKVAAALKKTRLGITGAGGSQDVWIRIFLNAHGVNPDNDLTITPVGLQKLPSLDAGKIDTFVGSPPEPEIATRSGSVGWNMDQAPEFHGLLFTTIATSKNLIDKDPATVQGFVRAMSKAMKYAQDNNQAAYSIAQAALAPSDADSFKLAWDAEQPLRKGPMPTDDGYQKALTIYNKTAKEPLALPLDQAFAMQFVQAASK